MKLFKDMLDTFMDGVRRANPRSSADELNTFEHGLRERIKKEPPASIALIGDTGVGKSSTLNALFNAGQPVGHTRATTMAECGIPVNFGPHDTENGGLLVYDMPGLNESLKMREQHLATYARVLPHVDVALWVLPAGPVRPMEKVQSFLAEDMRRINPELVNRVVFALNMVDLVHPGRHGWHPDAHLPSPEQEANIDARIADVRRLVLEALPGWKGQIIGYSATERYNLPQLFAAMLSAVGERRQWVFAGQKALADYFEIVDERYLPPERRPAKPPKSTPSKGDGLADLVAGLSEEQVQQINALLAERERRQQGS